MSKFFFASFKKKISWIATDYAVSYWIKLKNYIINIIHFILLSPKLQEVWVALHFIIFLDFLSYGKHISVIQLCDVSLVRLLYVIDLFYGTETWAMKAEKSSYEHSLERAEHMMVRWMFGILLMDRRCTLDLYSLLGFWQMWWGVADWLRWLGHLDCNGVDDWMSVYLPVEM